MPAGSQARAMFGTNIIGTMASMFQPGKKKPSATAAAAQAGKV